MKDLPFFFQKPHDSLFQAKAIKYPFNTSQLGFEVELVAIMKNSTEPFGYAVGIDFTKRDIQSEAKKAGKPWESAKSFDKSGLLGPIVHADSVGDLPECEIEFRQNGNVKQFARISQMIWSIPELVAELKNQDFSVKEGDVIFTGTPAGVGLLSVGDQCIATLRRGGEDIVPPLTFTVE